MPIFSPKLSPLRRQWLDPWSATACAHDAVPRLHDPGELAAGVPPLEGEPHHYFYLSLKSQYEIPPKFPFFLDLMLKIWFMENTWSDDFPQLYTLNLHLVRRCPTLNDARGPHSRRARQRWQLAVILARNPPGPQGHVTWKSSVQRWNMVQLAQKNDERGILDLFKYLIVEKIWKVERCIWPTTKWGFLEFRRIYVDVVGFSVIFILITMKSGVV